MPAKVLAPEIRRCGEVPERKFDPRSATPLLYKSTSEETRMAYRHTLLRVLPLRGVKHHAGVSPQRCEVEECAAIAQEERGVRRLQTVGRAFLPFGKQISSRMV